MAAVVVAMLVAVAVCIVALAVRTVRDYKTASTDLGPPGLPFLGHALSFMSCDADGVFPVLLGLIGGRDLCRLAIMHRQFFIISDPAGVAEVVRRKEFNDKSTFAYSLMHTVTRRGLITLGGPEWKEHRALLAPGFRKSILDTFIKDFNDVAKGFLKSVPTDEEAQLPELLADPLTRAFILTSLGDDLKDENIDAEFLKGIMRSFAERAFNPLVWPDTLYALTTAGRNLQRMSKAFDKFIRLFMERKRVALKNSEEPAAMQRTLVDIMLGTGTTEAMEEQAILDEVKTFFMASVDTSGKTLAWAFKILSLLPEVQQRLLAEIDDVFGDSDRDVSVEDIQQLKYTERFLKEVMRMYPPVPLLGRQCYSDTELLGHKVSAGTTIGFNIFSAMRHPRYWPDPDRFDPDRYLPENSKDRYPYAYLAFSAGSRNCIGGTYAMHLMTTLLATVLRAVSVWPVDDGFKDLRDLSSNMSYGITSGLRGGIRVQFRSRITAGTERRASRGPPSPGCDPVGSRGLKNKI